MARVFRQKSVHQARFPLSVDDFGKAAAQAATSLLGRSWFRGGLFYGSYVEKRYGITSDLDLFLAYEGSALAVAEFMGTLVDEVESSTYVELSWHASPIDQLCLAPATALSPGIFRHMQECAAQYPKLSVIGASPLVYVSEEKLTRISRRQELIEYLEVGRSKLMKRLTAPKSSEEWYDLHRMFLDRPGHAVRRFMESKKLVWGNNSHAELLQGFEAHLLSNKVWSWVDLIEATHQLFNVRRYYSQQVRGIASLPNAAERERKHILALDEIRQHAAHFEFFTTEMLRLARSR
jgi:hypothetical protein